MTQTHLDEAQIREAAYYFWLEDGQPEGMDEAHWLKAIDALTPPKPKRKAATKAAPKAKAAAKPAAKTKAKATAKPKTATADKAKSAPKRASRAKAKSAAK